MPETTAGCASAPSTIRSELVEPGFELRDARAGLLELLAEPSALRRVRVRLGLRRRRRLGSRFGGGLGLRRRAARGSLSARNRHEHPAEAALGDVLGERPRGERLRRLLLHGGRPQRLCDALECLPARPEVVTRRREELIEPLAMRALGVTEAGGVAAGDGRPLRLPERGARLDECLQLLRVPPGELVDGPRGNARLPKSLDLVRRLPIPRLAQLARELVAGARELLEREPVEVGGVRESAQGARSYARLAR